MDDEILIQFPEEIKNIGEKQLKELGPYKEQTVFFQKIFHIFQEHIYDFFKAKQLTSVLSSSGLVLLQNLPIDPNIPQTPNISQNEQKMTALSEACLLGTAQYIGKPYGIAHERNGQIVQDIIPKSTFEHSISSFNSLSPLLMHNENIFSHPKHPNYILLYCIKKDPQNIARTQVADMKKVIASLNSKSIDVLKQPLFRVLSPESFNTKQTLSQPFAIYSQTQGTEQFMVDFDDMQGETDQATQAIHQLKQIVYDKNYFLNINLEPGEMLIIDNRRYIHGRNVFSPAFNGNDRWLQRVYVKT